MASACSSRSRFPLPQPPPSASSFSFEEDDSQTNSDHGFLGYAPISLSNVADPRNSAAACLFHGFATVGESMMENSNSEETCSSSFSSSFVSSHSDDEDDEDLQDTSTSSDSSSLSQSPEDGPLNTLESLCSSLPIKRGLSRYFSGKSQSFSSLAHASSVEDLAKPENPYAKKRKMQVQAALHLKNQSYPPRSSSSVSIAKRHSNSRFGRSPPKSFSSKKAPWPAKCFSVPELQDNDWENAVSFSLKP